MRRALAAALAAGVCSATLAGCTDDSSAGPTTSTSPGTTSAIPSTTTEPTESTTSAPVTEPRPPVMPALAKEQSKAGAKAFVRYAVDALNYGYLQGNADAFATVSSKNCPVCSALQANVKRIDRRGGMQVGGEWSTTSIDEVPSGTPARPIFIAAVRIADGWTTPSANATRERIRPAETFFEFHLRWTKSGWQLTDLRQG